MKKPTLLFKYPFEYEYKKKVFEETLRHYEEALIRYFSSPIGGNLPDQEIRAAVVQDEHRLTLLKAWRDYQALHYPVAVEVLDGD